MGPLVVGYVGNFTRSWCTEVHVAGSLEQLGHRVIRWQENELDWTRLPDMADEAGIQLVLWTRTWGVDHAACLSALDELRARRVPTVSYHLDRWWGLEREYQVESEPFFRTDLVVSPDGGNDDRWRAAGVDHRWMPPGVYRAECDPVEPNPKRWPWPVVFVGSYPYPHPAWAGYRHQLVTAFRRRFRRDFQVLPRRGQPIRGGDLAELYATAQVVVGDSCLVGDPVRYWSDRIPETLGRGGLLIHPNVEGLSDWYQPGEDLLTYPAGDFALAVKQAEWALANPQDVRLIADHGRATVLGRDTYAHRMADLLTEVERRWDLRDVSSMPAPISPPVAPLREHRQVRVRLHRWSARFDPRPGGVDVTDGDFVVVSEVWGRNDYRVPSQGLSGTVLDVGANVGAFSVLAAKAGARRVIAVEPHPGNRARLEHHLALNGVAGLVTVLPVAVTGGDTPTVHLDGVGGGVHVADQGDEVETVTLSLLLAEYGPISFMKMDIEGGEYDALWHTTATELREQVERIAMEWHGPVMPHLTHLAVTSDGQGDDRVAFAMLRWGPLVAKLADAGRVETFGHPMAGGILHWTRY